MTHAPSARNTPLVRSVFAHHIESSPDSLIRVRHFDATSTLLASASVMRRHVLETWEMEVATCRARSRNGSLTSEDVQQARLAVQVVTVSPVVSALLDASTIASLPASCSSMARLSESVRVCKRLLSDLCLSFPAVRIKCISLLLRRRRRLLVFLARSRSHKENADVVDHDASSALVEVTILSMIRFLRRCDPHSEMKRVATTCVRHYGELARVVFTSAIDEVAMEGAREAMKKTVSCEF
jgi:hypothetical protein